MNIKELFPVGVGCASMAFGAIMLLGIALQFEEGYQFGDFVGFVLLGLAPLAFGIFLALRAWNHRVAQKHVDAERTILHLARTHGGSLTPQILAVETDFSLQEAKESLEKLHQDGFCQLDLEDDGDLVYRFAGLDLDPASQLPPPPE